MGELLWFYASWRVGLVCDRSVLGELDCKCVQMNTLLCFAFVFETRGGHAHTYANHVLISSHHSPNRL